MGKNIDGIDATATSLTGTERFALRTGSPDPDGDLDAKGEVSIIVPYVFSEIDSLTEQTAAEDTNLVPILDGTTPKYMSLTTLSTYMQNLIATARRGTIQMWGTDTAPTGALLCNGQAVSRTTYAALFAIYGTTFGVGDNSTTFNLPDFCGRSPLGVGTSTGGTDFTHVAETVELGTKYNDKMQLITGALSSVYRAGTGNGSSGAISWTKNSDTKPAAGSTDGNYSISFNSANSSGARTDTTTRGKGLGINFIVWY